MGAVYSYFDLRIGPSSCLHLDELRQTVDIYAARLIAFEKIGGIPENALYENFLASTKLRGAGWEITCIETLCLNRSLDISGSDPRKWQECSPWQTFCTKPSSRVHAGSLTGSLLSFAPASAASRSSQCVILTATSIIFYITQASRCQPFRV